MVRIRLRRVGAKKQPSYRIVVAEREMSRGGRFIETIGFYNPLTDPETLTIDAARAEHWLSHGAQPSDAVARLLAKAGVGKNAAAPMAEAPAAEEASAEEQPKAEA
jgi:small subunit ribosomal protein S16